MTLVFIKAQTSTYQYNSVLSFANNLIHVSRDVKPKF